MSRSQTILYKAGRQAVRLYTHLLLHLDVLWHSRPPKGPMLVVANHPSTTDPFYLLTLFAQPISLMLIDSPFRIPIFGRILHRSGHIEVQRADKHAAFNEAHKRLQANESVAIFPEGNHSPREGGTLSPRSGAARLALLTGVPVIPVGIYLRLSKAITITTKIGDRSATGYWYLRGPYGMTIGNPMKFHGDSQDGDCVAGTSETIMRQITKLAKDSENRIEAARK
jgi:1-acyl-sn-glycerol-3-phosphate acyltransferase